VHRRRQCHEVAEDDPGDEQAGGKEDEERHLTLALFLERRRKEGPQLPEDDRQGEQEARVQTDLERGQEWLCDSEGDRPAHSTLGQRPVQPMNEVSVEDITDHEPNGQRTQRHEETRAQLVEMLDQRRLLAVAKAPREPLHSLGDGVALARGSLSGRRRDGELCRLVVLVLAADRILELAKTPAHRATDLWKPFCPEEQQRKQQQENDLTGADVRHALRVARFASPKREQTQGWPERSRSHGRSS